MPHLSPMKWFNIFILMIFLSIIFSIKMNFFILLTPKKKMSTNFMINMNWNMC